MTGTISRRGLIATGIVVGASATVPIHAQRKRDVPFVVSPPTIVDAMLDLAALKSGEHLIDLGSGDGRIVLAAARRGANAFGIEIDAELVDRARRRAELEGLQARAKFERGDLFTASLRDADVVTMYLLTAINQRLRPKLLTELRPGTRLVSHAFDMGDWSPDGQRVVDDKRIFLWIVPATAGGAWRYSANGRTGSLQIEQRFQRVTGTLDGQPLDMILRGDRLFFRAGDGEHHGIVGDRTITPDPARPEAVQGWKVEREDS